MANHDENNNNLEIQMTSTKFIHIIISAALAISLSGPAFGKSPDLIIHNAKITTVDVSKPTASALAVVDGIISAVGENKQILNLKGAKTQVIDAQNQRLIPGINDSHLHVIRGGRFFNQELRWDGVPSLKMALDLLEEQVSRTPKGEWVRVLGGWSPYQFEEKRLPSVEELDRVAPDTPVFVQFLYSKAFLNKAGMVALGIDKSAKAPAGSYFERDADGNPTGVLVADPTAFIFGRAYDAFSKLTIEGQMNSTLQFHRKLLSFGETSAIDMGGGGHIFPENYVASKTLSERGQLPLRVSYYVHPLPGDEIQGYSRYMQQNIVNKNLHTSRPDGYVLEGGGEGIVVATMDFENFLSPRPELKSDGFELLEKVVRLHIDNGWPFRIHATYGESIEQMLDVFERIDKDQSMAKIRWAIDHAETVSNNSLERIKALGGGIAIQNRMAFAGEYFVERYGEDLAKRAPPVREMLDMGIPVGAGTDGTRVSSLNPWPGLYWLVSGKTVGGTVLKDEPNRLSRLEALTVYTNGSAWFSGEENVKGKIKRGFYADFALLSEDYMEVAEDHIPLIKSDLTVVGGKIEHGNRKFASLNPPLPDPIPNWSPITLDESTPVYIADKSHTHILMKISHPGFSNYYLKVRDYNGYVRFDPENLAATKVELVMQAASIDGDHEGLNKHLQSSDFFDVANYPEITFSASDIKLNREGKGSLKGDLTIRGITKSIVLEVSLNKHARSPATGLETIGISAQATINRHDFGVSYGAILSENVELIIEAEFSRRM